MCEGLAMSFGVSFVSDKTPLAEPGTIAAYERVLCSTLIYVCVSVMTPYGLSPSIINFCPSSQSGFTLAAELSK